MRWQPSSWTISGTITDSVVQSAFYFLSFVAVISAVMVVFARNAVFSVLYLIITFFALAGHYVLLKAEFLAVVHVIVYAGAIMVLFLYVIMLLNLNLDSEPVRRPISRVIAVICAGMLMVLLVASLKSVEAASTGTPLAGGFGSVKSLGRVLFTDFLYPFEVTSLLLLAAMVGAVMLGKKDKEQNPS